METLTKSLPFTNITLKGDFVEYTSLEGVRYFLEIDRYWICYDFSEMDYDSETCSMQRTLPEITDITDAQWCAFIQANIEDAKICGEWLQSINESDWIAKWEICNFSFIIAGEERKINPTKRIWDVEYKWLNRAHEIFQVVKKLETYNNPF
jgi:hypothetical protein